MGPTHRIKQYSMESWLTAMRAMGEKVKAERNVDYEVMVVDNSEPEHEFSKWMADQCALFNCTYRKLEGDYSKALVHDRIADSMNLAREYLLENGFDYLCIDEVDVLPSETGLLKLYEYLTQHNLDAIQGQYYEGYTWERFQEDQFWLCGLNLIKASVFENIKFRYDKELLGALPDAFLGHDMGQMGLSKGFHPTVRAIHYDDGTRRGWNNLG